MELKPDSGLTSCCTAECTLKAGATCRYVEYVGKSVVMDVLIPGRSVMRDSGEEWSLNLTVSGLRMLRILDNKFATKCFFIFQSCELQMLYQ